MIIMKSFLLGVGVGILLTCACVGMTAAVKQFRLVKAEQGARAAATAAETAAAQAPAR